MDEFGISAEHLQKAKAILTPIITTIFNRSIEENSIPIFFKTESANPVLKKSKDATQVESYRGITVTPTFTNFLNMVYCQD